MSKRLFSLFFVCLMCVQLAAASAPAAKETLSLLTLNSRPSCFNRLIYASIWETDFKFAITLIILLALSVIVIVVINIFVYKMRRQKKDMAVFQELLEKDETIREVKERLEMVIQTAPVSYLMNINGKVAEINDAMSRDTGLKVGDSVAGIYADEHERARLRRKLYAEKRLTNEIARFRLANGKIHRCLLNVSAVEAGQQDAYVVWALDFETDEKKKDQLKMAQQNLQLFLDVLPIPIRIVDIERETIVYVNDAFMQLFKYDYTDEIYGKKLIEIVPAFQNNGVAAEHKVRLSVGTKELIEIEVDYCAADGSRIEALLTSRCIEFGGRPVSIGIIRDLKQERREAELRRAAVSAEAASRAKSAFIANMSHEIRTPMNSIVGFAELALVNKLPPETRSYLIKIRESSNILLRIINDILDISKIESGKIELETIPFDIHEIFTACQTLISPRATEKGINLFCYAEPSVEKKLVGDPTKLRQAILNLLTNAVKFTNAGTVKLMAAVKDKTEDSVTVYFEVKDTGIGIAQEQLDAIFDPFIQADQSTTREYGGTGLGLSITKNIVELMGGELNVESKMGEGSKFSFTLTFNTVKTNPVQDDIEQLGKLEKPTFDGDVLVCEDNAMNRQVICEHLERVGLTPVMAVNGLAGVELVKKRMETGQKPFDLIFMDIHMPVMDGLEATQKLNDMKSTSPVIALTANVMTGDRKTYSDYGMKNYLAKPFKTQELWDCLLKYLNPNRMTDVGRESFLENEAEQQKKLRICFAQDHKTACADIDEAISSGNIKEAIRLAHSMKSIAGLVGRTILQEAAAVVERALTAKGTVNEDTLNTYKNEIKAALAEFSGLEIENKQPAAEVSEDFFVTLEKYLTESDSDSINCVDTLRALPGAGDLIMQIERYDFAQALENVQKNKAKWLGKQ